MPFSKEFDDVYQLGIKPACKNAGAYAERVDEQIFGGSILDRIYNQIAKADIVISDMTGRNPNVFYETGYAHALDKAVILMTQKLDDIPFDLRHYPHIIYEGRIINLIPEIEKRVKHLINQPNKKYVSEARMEFFVDGENLSSGAVVKNEVTSQTPNKFYLKLDAHNPISSTIQIQRFQLGIETSKMFSKSQVAMLDYREKPLNIIKLPNGRLLHLLDDNFEILPGAWATKYIILSTRGPNNLMTIGHKENIVLRMFTEKGVFEYPFELAVVEKQGK